MVGFVKCSFKGFLQRVSKALQGPHIRLYKRPFWFFKGALQGPYKGLKGLYIWPSKGSYNAL